MQDFQTETKKLNKSLSNSSQCTLEKLCQCAVKSCELYSQIKEWERHLQDDCAEVPAKTGEATVHGNRAGMGDP